MYKIRLLKFENKCPLTIKVAYTFICLPKCPPKLHINLKHLTGGSGEEHLQFKYIERMGSIVINFVMFAYKYIS